jgi:hypothetical protein
MRSSRDDAAESVAGFSRHAKEGSGGEESIYRDLTMPTGRVYCSEYAQDVERRRAAS